MAAFYDLTDPQQLLVGMRSARTAIGRGQVIVVPTDTVYGIAADAFNPDAVGRLLAVKGRDRTVPPPVLIGDRAPLDALAVEVPAAIRRLVDEFWPGGLTVILPAQPTLAWDLGETRGTVALRLPDHELLRELLRETGPLAVSSANRHGDPAAVTAEDARAALGDDIAVYLAAGASSGTASTIVDATGMQRGEPARIVRAGAISRAAIAAVLEDALAPERKVDG